MIQTRLPAALAERPRGFFARARRSRLFEPHRRFVFRRAMTAFLADPERCADPECGVLGELVYGWGNPGWSALHEFLAAAVRHALVSRGPILECGSGLSTLMIGAIASERGIAHCALEHQPRWAARVRRSLALYGIAANVLDCPLRSYGEFSWYDPPPDAMPKAFSLVVCDGPPGATHGGRYGLVPVLRHRFASSCVILLDDAGRQDERDIARRWAAKLGASLSTAGSDKPYAILSVGAAGE